MSKKYAIVSMLLVLTLSTLACGTVNIDSPRTQGSGRMAEKEVAVSGFSAVTLNGVGNLIVEFGEEESLVIEAEDNILPYIEVDVYGDRLEIGIKEHFNINPTRSIYYYLTVVELDSLTVTGVGDVQLPAMSVESFSILVSGVGKVDIDSLTADDLRVTLSGVGDVEIHDGAVTEQKLVISGAGSYHARSLEVENLVVTLSGIGSATVRASQTLEATISGTGDLKYYGTPAVQFTASGFGDLVQLGD